VQSLKQVFKTSFVKTDNNAIYDSLNYGIKVPDIGRSNHLFMKGNVNAAYVNFSKPLSKKLTGQFGLRLEKYSCKRKADNQLARNSTETIHNFSLLLTFQYVVDKNNNLGLNYGRRIIAKLSGSESIYYVP
jgi:hypothetical protein